MVQRRTWPTSGIFIVLQFVATAAIGQPAPEVPPNWRELPTEELMQLLPKEERAVLAEAERLKDEWLKKLERETATATMEAIKQIQQEIADKYIGQSVDIDEMVKKEIAAQANELMEAALVMARLPSSYMHGSTFVLFDYHGYCQDKYYSYRPLLEALCKAERPDGVPDGFPMILDPMLIAHCTLPSGLQAEAVRQTCREINGGDEPNNPLASYLRKEEAKRQQRLTAKREDFERRITETGDNPALVDQLRGANRTAPPATSIDALH